MIGSSSTILDFLEGSKSRFIIPVYQRKYSWKEEQCAQLYEDLKRTIRQNCRSHFFGSIVASVVGKGGTTEYHIIDGQQRLTTVSLLLLAIRNMIRRGKIQSENETMDQEINDLYLISPYAKEENKIKLRPVQEDREALYKLFGDEEDYDPFSQITLNYQFFCRELLKGEVGTDELYEAVGKLEIISITLDEGDNAQLIFESLNSTGLALEEGDKIRNYVLMGLSPREQNVYYEKYWVKIERCTRGDVSGFVRDYLSIRQQKTPTVSRVYLSFKAYAKEQEEAGLLMENLLEDLLGYARLYERLLTCRSGLGSQKLDDCLYRMKRLEIVVTRPFLMEVLRLTQDGKIPAEDVYQVFLITENYLFRRNICEVPTNALNKIFVNLNREILHYDNTAEHYVDKLIYALRSKRDSARFPDDEEFAQALSNKQVYRMKGTYKTYLFERFENYGTIETKDIYRHLENNDYTIEHIMPQNLTPAWREVLGPDAEEIHETWLHRLANLTLTGYNPNLSNKTFQEKRDAEEGGYRHSGLRMNQKISEKESWGLSELEERNLEMISRAKEIWKLPQTDYLPSLKDYLSCTLADEDFDLTGRDIVRYSYQNLEQPAGSWAEMFVSMLEFLHQIDRSVLSSMVSGRENDADTESFMDTLETSSHDPKKFVSADESALHRPKKIDENIYVETNNSTSQKLAILRRVFDLYGADPMDLIFYLRGEKAPVEEVDEPALYGIRRKYWAYALPMICERNKNGCSFQNVKPSKNNAVYGYFGIGGFSICCAANVDEARVELHLNKSDPAENKKAFDRLYSHREKIENELGTALTWKRLDDKKMSCIGLSLKDVSICNENEWPHMAEFHAFWSEQISETLFPYLQEGDDKNARLTQIAAILRGWTLSREGVNGDPAMCNRTYTRFKTDAMTAILPNLADVPGGWETDDHYFYEIINRTGCSVYINFVVSSGNIPDGYRAVCDRINELYPAMRSKQDWKFRTHFKTRTVTFGEVLSREEIFAGLDACLAEIRQFEKDLSEKLREFSR